MKAETGIGPTPAYRESMERWGKRTCACPSPDRFTCILMRYPNVPYPVADPCECGCHDLWEDDQDEW